MNAFLDAWNLAGDRAVALAWPLLVQSSVLVVVLLGFERLFRRRLRPAVRHALWLLVPLKLVLGPTLALPTSPVYWLPAAWLPADALPTEAGFGDAEPRPAVRGAEAGTGTVQAAVAGVDLRGGAGAVGGLGGAGTGSDLAASVSVPGRGLARRNGGLLLLWAFGAVGLLVGLGVRTRQLRRLMAEAGAAPAELLEALERARVRLGVRRRVGLRLIPDGHSPALCGLRRPVVLLPRGLAGRLGPDQIQAVLLHELAHARRADIWVNAIQTLLQLVWWWHPLVWLANARLRAAREECVDDVVAFELGPDDESYPSALLEVAKCALARPTPSLGLVGILESRSALRARIERLLEATPARPPRLGAWGWGVLAVAALVLLPMARGVSGPVAPAGEGSVPSGDGSIAAGRAPGEIDPMEADRQLADARIRLAELLLQYTDQSPLVIAMRSRITELERQSGQAAPLAPAWRVPTEWWSLLAAARGRLDELRAGHTDGHPAVVRQLARVAELERGLELGAPAVSGLRPSSDTNLARMALEPPLGTPSYRRRSGVGVPADSDTGILRRLRLVARVLAFGPEAVSALGLAESTNSPAAGTNYAPPLVHTNAQSPFLAAAEFEAFLAAVARRPDVESVSESRMWVGVGQEIEWPLIESSTDHPAAISLRVLPEWREGGRRAHLTWVVRTTEIIDLSRASEAGKLGVDAGGGVGGGPGAATYAVNAVGYINRTRTNAVVLGEGQSCLMAAPLRSEAYRASDKVVVLGDIPWIGRLFRNETTGTRTRHEVVLLTAEWVAAEGRPAVPSGPGE